jgi:hypothetical protein
VTDIRPEEQGVYTVFVDEWTTERGTGAGVELDLTNIEATDLEMFQQEGFSILRPCAR